MKTIYLHLGFHKTASTSFQESCLKNYDLLESHGIHYPSYIIKENNRAKPNSNHGFLMELALSGQTNSRSSSRKLARKKIHSSKASTDLVNSLSEKLEEITANCLPSTIISGEHISQWGVDQLIRLREYFDTKNCIIKPFALVRSPFEFAASGIQERIKGGTYSPYITINNKCVNLEDISHHKVPLKHKHIIKLNKAFEGQLNYAPFRKACQHRYGPVGFILEEFIDINNSLFDQFEFITVNESRSNLWVRIQNEINKVYPKYKVRNGNVRLNPLEVKLPLLTKIERRQEKFRLSEEEYMLMEKHITNSENVIKQVLGSEYINPRKEFSLPQNILMEDIVQYLTNVKKISHSIKESP